MTAPEDHVAFQRAFHAWCADNHDRFAVRLRQVRRDVRHTEMVFTGITPIVSVSVAREEISVCVSDQGEILDLLIDTECAVQRSARGYECGLCDANSRVAYPSAEALWHEHVFEEFLAWVNDRLAPARWLRLVRPDGNGASWATLLPDDDVSVENDPTVRLLSGLRSLSGGRAYDPENDQGRLKVWVVPLHIESGAGNRAGEVMR